MDINRTEALSALLRRAGWDIAPNAYRHEYAGIYVGVDGHAGDVLVNRSGVSMNMDTARRIAETLEGTDGITNVKVCLPGKGYAVRVTFDCTGYAGSSAPSASTWGAATRWR